MKRIFTSIIVLFIAASAYAQVGVGFYSSIKVINKKSQYYAGDIVTLEIVNSKLTTSETFQIYPTNVGETKKWPIDTTLAGITSMGNNTYRVNITVLNTWISGAVMIRLNSKNVNRLVDSNNPNYQDYVMVNNLSADIEDAELLPNTQGYYVIYTAEGIKVADYEGAALRQDLQAGVYIYRFSDNKRVKSGKYIVK